MNTKFFFSAIALFAITSVANALPIGQHVKFPQVNEEVATSAVFKGVRVTGVNEEVATSAVIRRAEAVRVNEEVATSAVIKGAEVKSGMEVAARVGLKIWPRVSDTERAKDVAFFIFPNPYLTKRHIPTVL